MRRRAILAAMAAWALPARAQNIHALEVEGAAQRLRLWIEAYQAGAYADQWRLTDSRIRRWFGRDRWRRMMRASAQRNGALLSVQTASAALASAADLPCTEQRHCFRDGVPYALFLLHTAYERATPAQPEFAVMAHSDEGWSFGGGTLLNRPLGETAVILTEADERRYAPDLSGIRR